MGVGVGTRIAEKARMARVSVSATGRSAAVSTQRPYLVDLCDRGFGVYLLEPLAVTLLEPGPQQLAHTGQQSVLLGEGFRHDHEVDWHFVGLQLRRRGALLQRLVQRGLHSVHVVVELAECVEGRHDDSQQV